MWCCCLVWHRFKCFFSIRHYLYGEQAIDAAEISKKVKRKWMHMFPHVQVSIPDNLLLGTLNNQKFFYIKEIWIKSLFSVSTSICGSRSIVGAIGFILYYWICYPITGNQLVDLLCFKLIASSSSILLFLRCNQNSWRLLALKRWNLGRGRTAMTIISIVIHRIQWFSQQI